MDTRKGVFQFIVFKLRNFIIGVVHPRAELRGRGNKLFAKSADFFAQRTLKSAERGFNALLVLRVNDTHHGLCLGEVKLSVEKGAFCEFTGGGRSCSGGKNGAQNTSENKKAAVAGKLNNIFTGVAFRCAENKGNAFVNSFSAGNSEAVRRAVAFECGQTLFSARLKNAFGNRDCILTRDADNSD